jgi:hypothetical protein
MFETSLWVTTAGFGLLCLAMFVLALRFGPRRGTWAQPAAKFVPPGRKLAWTLYAFGLAHVALGVAATGPVDGANAVATVVIETVMGLFYVACGKVVLIAGLVGRYDRRANTASA